MEQRITPGGSGRNVDKLLRQPALGADLPYDKSIIVWQSRKPDNAEPSILDVRVLTELEATAARKISKTGDGPKPELTAIRARHHELARLLASGMKEGEVAEVLGMARATISSLKRSPAFIALLAHYMALRDKESLGIRERLEQAGLDVLLLIQERLQVSPDEVPIETLRKLAETFLDRSGFNPVQKQITMNAGLSAADIAEIRKQNEPRTIDLPAERTERSEREPSEQPTASNADSEPSARVGPPHGGIDFAAYAFPKDEGNEGGGTGV